MAVAAKSDIERVDLVRNGDVIFSEAPRNWWAELQWKDETDLSELAFTSPHLGRFVYYYVRVTCTSGAQAWSSPLWFAER